MNSMERLAIKKEVIDRMIAHAHEQLPYEACGLLSGRGKNAWQIWELINESNKLNRFYVGEAATRAVLDCIAAAGEKALAIYHSHPTSRAFPSSADLIYHPDPEILMVIISLKHQVPDIKCFKIVGRKYSEYSLHIGGA